jgi:LysM repeat protein
MMKQLRIILIILFCSCVVVKPVYAAPFLVPSAYDLIDAVNAYRAANGLPALVIDPLLMLSAQMHAEYLAAQEGMKSGHVGEGGTDADARAAAVGYAQVPGLDINENWASMPLDADLHALIYNAWGDSVHTHTMLHQVGQHVGAGVAVSGDSVIYVLNVAAFWGDAGLTVQPTSGAYPGLASGESVSQYIAPVQIAEADEQGRVIHQVLQGQTLWSIATTYGVTIEQIRQLNGLTSDSMIYAGNKLLIEIMPTPSMVPSVTIGPLPSTTFEYHASVFPQLLPTKTMFATDKSNDHSSGSDQFVFIGIVVIAILGFALVFLGQRDER